ncbi:hypothetical protein [Halalkalibacter urbisdiaboli]|uniref:hypothetical protein n=1 Tax=Halalkalibacter urbisdiaboli TaxID=1960589 RepID=UPI000B4430E6|nr:hypothetical protein [Halalkalibacter urbisdiaboli]
MRKLIVVPARYTMYEMDGPDQHEIHNFDGYLDIVHAQIFYVLDGVLRMSSFDYDTSDGVYVVNGHSSVYLMNVSDPDNYNFERFLTFYDRLHETSLFRFLFAYYDRRNDENLRLERMM